MRLTMLFATRPHGTVEAVYIQLLPAAVHHTEEISEDVLLADYAENGELVGIEILAPVRISELEKLINHSLLGAW